MESISRISGLLESGKSIFMFSKPDALQCASNFNELTRSYSSRSDPRCGASCEELPDRWKRGGETYEYACDQEIAGQSE